MLYVGLAFSPGEGYFTLVMGRKREKYFSAQEIGEKLPNVFISRSSSLAHSGDGYTHKYHNVKMCKRSPIY